MTFRYASEFNHDLSEVENIARSVELMVGALFDFDALESEVYYMDRLKSTIKPVIKSLAEEGNRTQSAYIFFLPSLDGRAHDVWYSDLDYSGEVKLQETFDAAYYDEFTEEKEWFFMPFTSKQPYWTNPYWGNADYDAHINYISHTRPVIVENQVVGVAGSDYHFNLMREDIEAIQVYDSGKAFLFNEKGDVLIHENIPELMNLKDFEKGQYEWMLKNFNDNDYGTFNYKWIDGEAKLLTYKLLNNQWIFGLTVNVDEVFTWYTQLRSILVWAVIFSLALLLYLAYRMGHYITKDLVTLTNHVSVIGNGDYDHGLTDGLLNKSDETGVLARSIEKMRLQQKKLLIK
jgi:methyl-accepting chemotaxis protein